MVVVREKAIEKRVAQAVVIVGEPLRVGIPILNVGLGPDVGVLVVLLPLSVSQCLLVGPGVEELLVIFLDEVAVRCVGDFELQPHIFKHVVVVIGKKALKVTDIHSSPL